MAKKTNKTSHVMDLLTNGTSVEGADSTGEAAAGGQEKKSDVQSHTVTPAKVTVVDEGSRNDRISQEILGKLTEELEAETKQEAANTGAVSQDAIPAQEADAAAQTSAEQDATVSEASEGVSQASDPSVQELAADTEKAAAEASQSATESAPEASQTQNTHKVPTSPHPIIPKSHFASRTEDREYQFVNVMEQLLMRQDLEAVLTQHNVCTCLRCMSDVCALTLTGLPSKYVVTSTDSVSPLLSYYENKYKIPVLTELMKACNRVREHPHHQRTDT